MSFTNFPLDQNVAGGLGGRADAQISRDALRNQIQPSKDIMISRTPSGTFLTLRSNAGGSSGGGGGGGGAVDVVKFICFGDSDLPTRVAGTYGGDETANFISAFRAGGSTSDAVDIWLPSNLRLINRPHPDAFIRAPYSDGEEIFCTPYQSAESGYGGIHWLDLNVNARQWGLETTICQAGSARSHWVAVT
jgi:hypothetical protein